MRAATERLAIKALDVQVLHIQRVVFDEFAARTHIVFKKRNFPLSHTKKHEEREETIRIR